LGGWPAQFSLLPTRSHAPRRRAVGMACGGGSGWRTQCAGGPDVNGCVTLARQRWMAEHMGRPGALDETPASPPGQDGFRSLSLCSVTGLAMRRGGRAWRGAVSCGRAGLSRILHATHTTTKAKAERRERTALAFTRYCFTSRLHCLLHNNSFCKHPLSCAMYCTILRVMAPPAQF